MTAAASVAAQLDQLGQAVAAAHAEVSAGRLVELSDFGQRVGDICAILESQPREQAEALAPKLRDLRDALDSLAAAVLGLLNQIAAPPQKPS